MSKYLKSGYRVDFTAREISERDVSKATRAVYRRPVLHVVEIGRTRYVSVSANQLLEDLSASDRSRPGHLS